MPLLNRETLVDRPTIVDRGDEEDEQDNKESEGLTVETLGEGGGPTINSLEFEKGDYNVVAGANTAAVLATGEQGGEAFEASFVNAAVQLKDLQAEGEGIRDIARFGLENGVAELGLSVEEINSLREIEDVDEEENSEDEEIEEESADEEVQDDDTESEDDSNIEEVEDEIEKVKNTSEETDEEE